MSLEAWLQGFVQILSHRGYWSESIEKNSFGSFERSFSTGFGTETDFRDRNGELVISHDLPSDTSLAAREFFALAREFTGLPLALNIKADGLVDLLVDALEPEALRRAFVFDMAVPDMKSYLDSPLRVFTRHSEIEMLPAWLERCDGIWLDSFGPEWFESDLIAQHLDRGIDVCVVSPELHGREPESVWAMLRGYRSCDRLLLCTDYPEAAQAFLMEAQ